jgi:uncharacterized protein YsxB (DUF464 family)
MINVKFSTDNSTYFGMDVKGHAEFNPGNDIVCSSISTLAYTFLGMIMEMEKSFSKKVESGDYHCRVWVNKRDTADFTRLKTVYDTICVGVQLVAQSYPENVTVVLDEKTSI